MIRFLDGPAVGVTLVLRRTPIFLRVVRGRGGKWDGLDQPDDDPGPTETVYVYALHEHQGGWWWKCQPASEGGWLPNAAYRFFAEQPTDEIVRDGARWREWAEEQRERLRQENPTT